jgi:hypothetical protein
MNRKLLLGVSALAITACPAFAASPAFDVATIRPSPEAGRGSMLGVNPGNLVMRGYDLSR